MPFMIENIPGVHPSAVTGFEMKVANVEVPSIPSPHDIPPSTPHDPPPPSPHDPPATPAPHDPPATPAPHDPPVPSPNPPFTPDRPSSRDDPPSL
ncbi:MAG: hypothetical protein SGI77_25950 [Pirellulaceae bacterium]|nr:hypothetical protein [Pirellulaceae bacterium]